MTQKLGTPEDYVTRFGGKIGGYFFLKDLGKFEQFLPNADFLDWNEGFDKVQEKDRYRVSRFLTDDKFEPVIVRASHPNDHEGFVDVLESVANVRTPEELKRAVQRIRMQANRPEVFSYSAYEGRPYDGRTRIQIADQLMDDYGIYGQKPAYRGSIIEHPHQRGTYVIEVSVPTPTSVRVLERVIVREGEPVNFIEDGDENPISEMRPWYTQALQDIVSLYIQVQFSGFIPPEFSFQMEFGHTSHPKKDKAQVQFFQARPFKKFEEPTYTIGDHEKSKYLCFGITPQEGVELPFVVARGHNERDIMRRIKPYALGIEYNSTSQPLTFQPRNVAAYLALGTRAASLEHQHYRWIRKTEVSILDKGVTNSAKLFAKKIRIASDGINHAVKT